MESLNEVNLPADDGAEKECPAEEDTAEEKPCETSERQHVDALIDISEEELLTELEPFEFHCYNGWEEAVQGWARVDPLSCILLTPKTYRKAKQKGAATPTPLPVNTATPLDTENSSNASKPHCESHVGWKNSSEKSTPFNQPMKMWSNTNVAALQKHTSEWLFISTLQQTTSSLLHKDKMEEEGMLRQNHHASTKHSVWDNRPSRAQKHSHRPNSTIVPIKNFTFLPPINPPHLHPQRNSGHKAPDRETTEGNHHMVDNRTRTRGARMDFVANPELQTYSSVLTPKYRTCQHNPQMFSAVKVSISKRCQVPASSKPDTLHHTSYLTGTQALHPGTATGSHTHIHPNNSVCALKLFEGCEINV